MSEDSADDEAYTSSVIPTWANGPGDGGFWIHAQTVQEFMRYAVEPTFAAIEHRIADLQTREGAWQFEQSDLEDLRLETARAFALSLQSLWERQFRRWVGSINDHLQAHPPAVIHRADWPRLRTMFTAMKGVDPASIEGWFELETLNLIGNACRHGAGKSLDALRAQHPEFWSEHEGVVVTLPALQALAAASVAFWSAAEDIYNNSIRRKHRSTVKTVKAAEARWRDVAERRQAGETP